MWFHLWNISFLQEHQKGTSCRVEIFSDGFIQSLCMELQERENNTAKDNTAYHPCSSDHSSSRELFCYDIYI